MELVYGFCAKFAEIGSDGYFNVIGGGLDRIHAPQLPAPVPTMTLVGRISVPPEECGRRQQMRIELFDPQGTKLLPETAFPVDPSRDPVEPDRAVTFAFAFTIQNAVFEGEGQYEFHVSADGRRMGVVPLRVKLQRPATEGQA